MARDNAKWFSKLGRGVKIIFWKEVCHNEKFLDGSLITQLSGESRVNSNFFFCRKNPTSIDRTWTFHRKGFRSGSKFSYGKKSNQMTFYRKKKLLSVWTWIFQGLTTRIFKAFLKDIKFGFLKKIADAC